MTRTSGSKNIKAFEKCRVIATTSSAEIRHLAKAIGATPLQEFQGLLDHQTSYLKWLDARHTELLEAKKKLNSQNRGPKDAIYKKYRWYAEQQTLFETINAFEVFYKRTFINLAQALRPYIPADCIKGNIDAKVLWSMRGKASVPALIFEHQLFHDLENVDKTTNMLVESRRYNVGNPSKSMREKVKALQAVFQIRHTLAHNQGLITTSDSAKFGFHGYSATSNEIIDPTKSDAGKSVRRFLRQEAVDYTQWLLDVTAKYLRKISTENGTPLKSQTRARIEKKLGFSAALNALPWAIDA